MQNTLQAKITAPRLPQSFLKQATQAELFQRAREYPLILICAPAGYGKTTLASFYSQTIKGRSCWYALDESDNNSVVFGRYLVASLSRQLPLSEALLHKADQGLYQNLGDLLREVLLELEPYPDRVRLIFDDFHQLKHPSILSAITQFLRYLPPQMQVVMVSRVEPTALQHLFTQHKILRLTAQDLRLNTEAAMQLFSNHGHTVSIEVAHQLNEKAQGWVTGLKLIALNHCKTIPLNGTALALQGTEIRNYLFHEIYTQLNPELQDLLTKTAICERFNRELAQTLTDSPEVDQLLQTIDQQQFFLSHLGDDGTWFRYHPLLAEFLCEQISSPELASDLHRRAAGWWLGHGQCHIAAHHYALSADAASVSQFVLEYGWALFNSGHTQALGACLISLPPAAIAANLHITAMTAWLELVVMRRSERVLPLVQRAKQHLLQTVDAMTAQARVVGLLGSVLANVYIDTDDVDRADEWANAALRQWQHDPDSVSCASIHSILGEIAVHQGTLNAALQHALRAAELDRRHGHYLGVFWHLHQQAAHAYWSGDLNGVSRLLDSALVLIKTQGLGFIPIYDHWLRAKARTLWHRLQFQEAERYLQMAIAHNDDWNYTQTFNQIGLCQLALARQDHRAVEALETKLETTVLTQVLSLRAQANIYNVLIQIWGPQKNDGALHRFILSAASLRTSINPDQQQMTRNLALAQLYLNQLQTAHDLLADALPIALQHSLIMDYHQGAVLQAAVLWKLGQEHAALNQLLPTLEWVATQQAFMCVLPFGKLLEPALNKLKESNRAASRLLQLIGQQQQQARRSPTDKLPDIARAHGLTPQEWQLLQLIGQGLSNDEMCDRLHVSMNTIRSHIRHLNKKLDICTRSEAIQMSLKLQAGDIGR